MDVAVKVAAMGLCSALMALLLRKSNPELALCLGLAGGAVVLLCAFELMSELTDTLRAARELTGLPEKVFSPLLKCVAVGIICSLAGEACRDAGSSQLASAVDLAGAVAALFCALPLVTSLLETVEGLL